MKESPPEKREGSLASVLVTESIDPSPIHHFPSFWQAKGQKAGRQIAATNNQNFEAHPPNPEAKPLNPETQAKRQQRGTACKGHPLLTLQLRRMALRRVVWRPTHPC